MHFGRFFNESRRIDLGHACAQIGNILPRLIRAAIAVTRTYRFLSLSVLPPSLEASATLGRRKCLFPPNLALTSFASSPEPP